jgi:EpsI family protein
MQKRVIVLLAGLVVAAVAVARADRAETIPLRTSFSVFPNQIGDWRGSQDGNLTPREVEVLGVSDYVVRTYFKPNVGAIGLYIGYWESQKQGSSIHSPQNCLPGAGWEPVSQSILPFPDPRTPGAPDVTVNRYIVQKGLDKVLVLYWFQSHGRVVASEYWSKFYLVSDAVRLNRTDGAIVRLTSPLGDGPDAEAQAQRAAMAFAHDLMPKLDAFLPN